jgi:hypothetical protein
VNSADARPPLFPDAKSAPSSSVTLANWLREKKVGFCLRLKKNVCIETESELWSELKMLGLEPGNSFFDREVTIRKTAPIKGFNLAGKWLGKYRNVTTKEPWYILTSLVDLQAAVYAYAKRYCTTSGIDCPKLNADS